jgi:flavin reductase (DIM6/NTAB) family NADH-FMN oxidoreductase RutF
MTFASDDLRYAHRLLGPWVVYLVGTRSVTGEPNLHPVSNATSVSIRPQLIMIAVSKKWRTHENLQVTDGFTLSVPTVAHGEGVWRLGARYSGHRFADRAVKMAASGLAITDDAALPGPVLADGPGWLSCQVIARPDLPGDHGVAVGEVTQGHFNPGFLNRNGEPVDGLHPLMQITGNCFTSAGSSFTIPYGPHAKGGQTR